MTHIGETQRVFQAKNWANGVWNGFNVISHEYMGCAGFESTISLVVKFWFSGGLYHCITTPYVGIDIGTVMKKMFVEGVFSYKSAMQ